MGAYMAGAGGISSYEVRDMLGQVVYQKGTRGRGRLERAEIGGLPVLRVQVDPEGYWGRRRIRRAAKLLERAGSARVLVPEEFPFWGELEAFGLRPVDPVPFLRFQAAELMVAALRRRGRAPEQCAVALRGNRADRDLVRAAQRLCPQVRDVCVSVPRGGEALSEQLRWEFGAAVRPDHGDVAGAVRFAPDTWQAGETVLDLFGPQADLGGVEVRAPGLDCAQTQPLPLLAALWETGKVGEKDLKFT